MTNNATQENIPQGWILKKLSDVLDYERPDKYIVKNTIYSKNGIPVLTANKSFILGYTNEESGACNNIPCIIFDDFTTDSKFVDFPFKVKSSAIKILRCKDKSCDLKFIYEVMKLINFPLGNHKRYYISQYQELEILIPKSKEEQEKISKILGSVDDNIKKTQEIIKTTEKMKKGLMQQLFTRGIGHTKFKKTKLGEIPESWDIEELGKICDVRDGTHASPKYYENGFPLITSKNLVGDSIDFENINFISKEDYNEIEKRSKVDDGDILFGMIGTIGNPVIVKKNRDFSIKNVALVKFKDNKIDNVFVLNFLKSEHTLNQFKQKMGGSTQKFIALGVIRKLLITVPEAQEQKKIAEIISAIDEKISINKKLKAKLTKLKKGLMQDLLSGRVRTI